MSAPPQPLPALRSEVPPGLPALASADRRPRLLGELAVVAFLLLGYDRVASATAVQPATADRHAAALLAIERSLHVAVEHTLDAALAPHRLLGQLLSLYYDLAHGLLTVGVLALLYVVRPDRYRSARTALLLVNAVALVVFRIFPVAPPRLLAGSGTVDVVAGSGTWGSWEASTSQLAQHADQYAAMPSLHAAWALWVVGGVWTLTRSRGLRALAVAHLVLTVGIVLSTGNHYVLDVLAGICLTAGAHRLTPRLPVWPVGATRRIRTAPDVPAGSAVGPGVS